MTKTTKNVAMLEQKLAAADAYFLEVAPEIVKLREQNAQLVEALEAADRVLFLLSDEVNKLGFGAKAVAVKVQTALEAARDGK